MESVITNPRQLRASTAGLFLKDLLEVQSLGSYTFYMSETQSSASLFFGERERFGEPQDVPDLTAIQLPSLYNIDLISEFIPSFAI